jgi:hypothetical protein
VRWADRDDEIATRHQLGHVRDSDEIGEFCALAGGVRAPGGRPDDLTGDGFEGRS